MKYKCAFCDIKDVILENKGALAFYDNYPVSKGHILVIPKEHIESYFYIPRSTRGNLWNLVEEAKKHLDKKYSPAGYNIGINCGDTAGQTIFHAHIHLIPRYKGDVKNPRGGVRGVIPHKQRYSILKYKNFKVCQID